MEGMDKTRPLITGSMAPEETDIQGEMYRNIFVRGVLRVYMGIIKCGLCLHGPWTSSSCNFCGGCMYPRAIPEVARAVDWDAEREFSCELVSRVRNLSADGLCPKALA